jgi:Leucine-rich repeat (LRR) protein
MGNGDSTAQPPQGHGHDPNKPIHNNNVNINNVDPTQTEIDLSDKNITELTKDLTKYSNLEIVNLNNNKLTSLVGIFSISKIRELSISNNLLKQIDEELFFLKQLQKVNINI